MKVNLLISTMFCTVWFSLNAQTISTFQKTYGGANDDYCYSIQQTSDEGYIMTGFSTAIGPGDDKVYLIKTNSSGDTLWTKKYGGTSLDWGRSVKQTSDGGYIVTGVTYSFGAGSYDIFLMKTDMNGNLLWTKTYGGTLEESSNSVQQTTDGGYIVTGYTYSYGVGEQDVYVIKTDSIGDLLWAKTYGGAYHDWGYSIQQTSDGGYIMTGFTQSYGAGSYEVYLIKTDDAGDTLWTKTYGEANADIGNSVQQTSEGGYIITGLTRSFGSGDSDVYLIKTDNSGDILWTKTYGGTDDDQGFHVQETYDGGYIITGETNSYGGGWTDVYLIKTSSNGDLLWSKAYGGTGLDFGNSVRQTLDSGYIVACYTGSFGAGEYDFYLIKTDANGNSGGCNEYDAPTTVSNTVAQVSSGAIITSSAIVTNPAANTTSSGIIDSVLCFTIGVQEINYPSKELHPYPNPFNSYSLLEFENLKRLKHGLTLYDSQGQLIRQIDNITTGQIKIGRGDLANGLYFFKLQTDHEMIGSGKFIIE